MLYNKRMSYLEGKNALITGSGSGIGQGVALEFAKQRACVVLNDVDSTKLSSSLIQIAEMGLKCYGVEGDITNPNIQRKLLSKVADLGGIDILVNNVGIGSGIYDFLQTPVEKWRKIWETNFMAGVDLTRGAVKQMTVKQKGGNIIFISSVHGERIARDAPYSTSKAAINMLIQELAVDLATYRIRVNGIAPGWIDIRPEAIQNCKPGDHFGKTPLGRAGLPEEVAKVAVFLASEEWSSYINGEIIAVDGGLRTFSHRTVEYPPQIPNF